MWTARSASRARVAVGCGSRSSLVSHRLRRSRSSNPPVLGEEAAEVLGDGGGLPVVVGGVAQEGLGQALAGLGLDADGLEVGLLGIHV
jgi:hypothetical protein